MERAANRRRRVVVRAENPGCACGAIGHLTADELRERAVGDEVSGFCPICGLVHLSRDEIDELERQKVVQSARFDRIREEAEGTGR